MSEETGSSFSPSGNFEHKDESIFSDYLQKFQDGLFGVLFITNKNSSHSSFVHFVELIIDHLQDLTFPLAFPFIAWQSEIAWLQVILNWVSPEKLIGDSQIVYTIIMSSLALVLLNATFVGYSFSQNTFRFIWTLKMLRGTLGLFATILFIPILSFLTNAIINCADDTSVCWSSSYLFKTVATVVISLLFICIALAVKATFFDPDPKREEVTGRPHSRIEMLYLIGRTILTILNICLSNFGHTNVISVSAAQWIMTLSCMAASSLLAFCYFWYAPFYNIKYSCLRSALMNNFLWASICMFYTLMRPNGDGGIFYLSNIPVIVLISIYAFYHRLDVLQRTPLREITDPYLMELQARLKLLKHNLLFPKSEHEEYDAALARNNETRINILGTKESKDLKTESDAQLLEEINEFYIQAAKILPKSCMLLLFSGMFQLNQMKNRSQCLATHAKATMLEPSLDEAFMIFRRKRLLNERFAGGDVINFIAFEQNLKQAKSNEKKATIAIVQFWSELLKKQPSYSNLQRHGAAIAASASTAQNHYLKLLKLSPDAPSVYRMYGSFLINIFNDNKQGQDMINRADELEHRDDQTVTSSNEGFGGMLTSKSNIDMFCNENGQVTVSGEIETLGIIKNVNSAFLSMFGFKKTEIIGHKLQVIIPEPFASIHDQFLRAYLETGVKKLIDTSRQVLGLNREWFLIPFDLLAKHMVDSRGKQSFVGVCRPVKMSAQSGFIIMDGDLQILHFSQLLGTQFKVNPHEKHDNLTITSWFPGITLETIGKITSKAGYSVTGLETAISAAASFIVKGEEVDLRGLKNYICEVRLLSAESFSESNYSSETSDDSMARMTEEEVDEGANSSSIVPALENIFAEDPNVKVCPMMASPLEGTTAATGPAAGTPPRHPLRESNSLRRQSYRPSLLNTDAMMKQGGGIAGANVTRRSTCATVNYESLGRTLGGTTGRYSENNRAGAGGSEYNSAISRRNSIGVKRLGSLKSNGVGSVYKSDAGDAHSIGSSSYASSKKDTTSGFIKAAVKVKNEVSAKRVFRLHMTFFLCYSVLISLSIFQTIDFSGIMMTLNSKFSQASTRIKGPARLMTALSYVRSVDLQRAGGYWTQSPMVPPLSTSQDQILQIVSNFQKDVGMVADFHTLNTTATYVYTADGPVNQQPLQYMLDTVGTLFDVGKAQISDPNLKGKVSYLVSNGINSVRKALNASGAAWRDDFKSYYSGKPLLTMLKASIGPVLSLIIIFGIRFPLYYQIELEKETFLKMFYEIPKEVSMGIYQSNYQRLMEIQEQEDEDDETELATKFEIDKVLDRSFDSGGATRISKSNRGAQQQGSVKPPEIGLFSRMLSWFSDQHKFALKTFVLFSVAFLYFYSTGLVLLCFLIGLGDVTNALFWSGQRRIFLFESLHVLQEKYVFLAEQALKSGALSNNSLLLSSNDSLAPYFMNATFPQPSNVLSKLDWAENLLLYGNTTLGVTPVTMLDPSSLEYSLEFTAGCQSEVSPGDCLTYLNGVCSQGINHMITYHIAHGRDLIRAMNISSISLDNMNRIEREITLLNNLAYNYSFPIMNLIVDHQSGDVLAKTSWFTNFNMICTMTYIIVLMILYFTTIRPFIHALDEDLKHTSVLAFMVPFDVFSSVPSFKRWLDNQKPCNADTGNNIKPSKDQPPSISSPTKTEKEI